MKSVTFSEIERVRKGPHHLVPTDPAQRLVLLMLSMVLGLPALVVAFHLIDPTAPLGYIVVPVLMGALLPTAARTLPGRLEVTTRFSACHLVGTLEDHHLVSRSADGRVRLALGLRRLASAVTPIVRSEAIADDSLAEIRARSRPGVAMAARIEITATTIRSSTSVNPRVAFTSSCTFSCSSGTTGSSFRAAPLP